MSRINWLDNETEAPALQKKVEKLEHFINAMADGVIDADELQVQTDNVTAAMKAVQDKLSDEQHALVTDLLVELSAYSIMGTLHAIAPPQKMGAA